MSTLKYPALQVKQGNKIIYTFTANGKHILDFASISRIKRNEEGTLEGYQRITVSKHIDDIANYLDSDDAILTNSIVICFDDHVKFEPLDEASGFGHLIIPGSEEKNGWIVDGQQRVTALSQIQKDDFNVVVNAFITNDAHEQKEQFILVNNTKPLPKSLIYELIPDVDVEVPKALADKRIPMLLIQELNSRKDSPFYKKIKTHTNPDGIIKDNTLIKAFNHSINDGILFNYTANIITGNMEADIEGMVSILYAYWGAVSQVFKDDWKLQPTKTRLTHGAGIIGLSFVMEELIHQIGEKEFYIAQDFLPHIENLAEKCSWSSGQWDFGNGVVREALEIQNINKDISMLAQYLMSNI
ncbi:DGQHR domain-containing protein DpdB [Sulfurovum sp.]|uniref:DGQHR domain-containing protein DpdB n=1 Tax=Sulfurovum sp. TaxID=1969726 RepID=UPI00356894D2